MGFRQAEDYTLPARFLTTTSHLVVTLCIVLDLDRTAARISASQAEKDATLSTLVPLAYTAMAFLLLETLGLFAGATIFNRPLTCFHILLHFLGTILVGLFIEEYWSLESYIILFTLFNALPAFLELWFGAFYLKGRFQEYRK